MIIKSSLIPLCLLTVASHAAAQSVTYSEQIAPIIYANCTTCHRPGQVAPFSLLTYSDAVKYGRTIASVTQSKTMPPWKAERGWTPLRDERGLTADQISLIQQWVAAGMPQGDPATAPAAPTYVDGWQLGTPDLVLTMPAGFNVPADGPDIYRNFVLPSGVTQDKWVRAVELRPSARTVVHHVLLYTDTRGSGRGQELATKDGQPGFPGFGSIIPLLINDPLNAVAGGLGGWVPGETPAFLPNGIAMYLPSGADVILQTHFHPNGLAAMEQTTLGIYYAPQPPRDISQVQVPAFFGIQANISIPANQNDYTVRGSFTLPVDVDAVSVSSHAHYLGKGTKLTATLPTGEVKILLWIRQWDINWQDTYVFKDLVPLPKGTRIDGELIYDNSSGNFRNPNSPPKVVNWGEQSTDEMGSLILNVVPKLQTNPTNMLADLSILRNQILTYTLTQAPQVGNKPLFISAGVVDGASAQPGAVTPGKIVVLYGQRMGPANLAGPQRQGDLLASTLSGSQVLFDGIPAPLLYSSTGQVSAIVPYELDGKAGTQIQVRNGAFLSDKVALPVTPAAPAIFSVDYTGSGQGAILNSDQTVNSTANAAGKGTIIVIYATGEGQTNPAGVNGLYAMNAYPKPQLPVTVNVGGLPAEVLYYGAAPTLVAGVMQVNARIPAEVSSGDVLVEVVVGNAKSQPGITVAVK